MNLLVYGDILETHVVESLCDELVRSGVVLTRLPSLTRSHRFLTDAVTAEQIYQILESVLVEKDIDVLFNFRVSELGPVHFELLKKKNVLTFGWLPDDPLLYEICYRHIADLYDVLLHCGHENVIRFYGERHPGANGFTFPFWTDEKHFPCCYELEKCEFDIGFLGNCHTASRNGRYELLSSLPFKVRFFGHPPKSGGDYCSIHGGYIREEAEIPHRIKKFRIGLSLPQFFRDSADTEYYFKELDLFESFYFPSRIVQYAACGIPALVKDTEYARDIIPSLVTFKTRDDLISKAQYLLNSPSELSNLSKSIHRDSLDFLSARARVDMLLFLFENHRDKFESSERAMLWRNFPLYDQSKKQIIPEEAGAGEACDYLDEAKRAMSRPKGRVKTFQEDAIDLSCGKIETQDGIMNGAVVERSMHRLIFMLNNPNDPKKGDFAKFSLSIPVREGGSYYLSLRIHNPYFNPKKLTGRIEWSLKVNNNLVHSEDIAETDELRRFGIRVDSRKDDISLELLIHALRDCEPWHWGLASKTSIQEVRLYIIEKVIT